MAMTDNIEPRLIELAKRAEAATRSGRLHWERTSEAPPEYMAHITDNTGLVIRRVLGERLAASTRQERNVGFFLELAEITPDRCHSRADTVEYLLALTTPDRGEIASLTSRQYDLDSAEYLAMETLFEAAQMEADAVNEHIDEALGAVAQPS